MISFGGIVLVSDLLSGWTSWDLIHVIFLLCYHGLEGTSTLIHHGSHTVLALSLFFFADIRWSCWV